MSTTAPSVVIGARIEPRHAQQLREIADRNASTVSRIAARIIAERLDRDHGNGAPLRLVSSEHQATG